MQPVDPELYCGFNVAIYGPDVRRWVFTEYDGSWVQRSAKYFHLGRNHLQWEKELLTIHIEDRTAVGKWPVRGQIRLQPAFLNTQSWPLDLGNRHWWCPIAPHGRLEVEFTNPRLRFTGSCYHDANHGQEALEAAFNRWTWSRAQLADTTAILYDVEPLASPATQRALRFYADGTFEPMVGLPRQDLPSTSWGIHRSTRCDAGYPPQVMHTLENTPFYARSLIQTSLHGQTGVAVHESLNLHRFNQSWVQKLLPFRMRRKWGKPQ